MSADRRKPANGPPAKPLTPRLAGSAAAARNSPAPKLAGYAPSSSSVASTPQHRRPLSTNTSELNITPRPLDGEIIAAKDLPSSITPRSSARKSRADSVHLTPTRGAEDTPTQRNSLRSANGAGSRSLVDEPQAADSARITSPASFATRVQQGQGYPLSPYVTTAPTRANTSYGPDERDSYFFRADDAPKESKPARPLPPKQTSSFMYANGEEESPGGLLAPLQTTSLPASRPASVSMIEGLALPDSQSSNATSPLSAVSRPVFSPPTQSANGGLRAASPPRQGIHLSYRKGVSQIMRPSPLASHSHSRSTVSRRQSSLDGIDEDISRRRTISVSSADSNNAVKHEEGLSLIHTFAVPSSTISPRLSPRSHPDLAGSVNGALSLDAHTDRLHSPPDMGDGSDGGSKLNEAAANARRERKILDLQISNSSLLAINRSLEKEVRKQKAELRRFRRMSRMATRESLLSQATEVTDALSSALSDAGDELADEPRSGEEHEDDEANHDDDEDSESDEFDEGPTSPGAIWQRDIRHRKGDQRRLLADLAKHKELLADSQRMNQSIVKCLGVTEQLIKDGNRALEYQVSLEEVRLGGRVLTPEEQEEADMSYVAERIEDLGVTASLETEDEQSQRQEGLLQDVLESTDALQAPGIVVNAFSTATVKG